MATAREAQRSGGGTLGEHLVAAGAVSDDALTEFYRSRLMVPQVSPTTLAKLPDRVITLLPGDMAVEYRAIPVALDKDGNLTVAMSDPSDRHAVDEIGFFTGKYVVRAVATQMQLAWCLAHYYDYVTELGERLMQPLPRLAAAGPATPAPAAAPITRHRGDTAKVDAARHRVLVPATAPPPVGAAPPAVPPAVVQPVAAASDRSGPVIEIVPDEPPEAGADDAFAPEPPIAPPPIAAPPRRAETARANVGAFESPHDHRPDPFGGPSIVVSPEASRPQRVRPAAPDPPELAARAGEMQGRVRDGRVDAPAMTIEINLGDTSGDDDAEPVIALDRKRAESPPAVLLVVDGQPSEAAPLVDRDEATIVSDLVDTESQPILLEHFRRGEPPPEAAPVASPIVDEPSGPVLLLDRKKGVAPRRDKRTVLGLGLIGAIPTSAELPPPGPRPPTMPPPMGLPLRTISSAAAANPPLSPELAWNAAQPTVQIPLRRPPTADEGVPTEVTDEEAATRRVAIDGGPASVDDGWGETTDGFEYGPPGTTIPPPFLGAMQPIDDLPSGQIPLATTAAVDSGPVPGTADAAPTRPNPAPLNPAPPAPAPAPPSPAPPAPIRTTAAPPIRLPLVADPAAMAKQLEEASLQLVDLLRGLDQAHSRDHVIAMLVDFVAASHHRAAFLAVKAGDVTAFMQSPEQPPGAPLARLDLTTASTFQDVIGTRLPYRGPIADAPSRNLVKAMFGSITDDMLAVPVAVRERVIGVIYADGRYRHSFDEHVTVGGRAAGLALERILKAKRS